jgi:eukaryotic-like serine/threonine-protein kinase
MLTGEPPHSGTTAQAVIAKVLTDRPRSIRLSRNTVPEHVEIATERALAKLPADRWATAHEFADALQGRGDAIPRAITTPGSIRAARPEALRARLRDPVVVTLAALLVCAIGTASWLAIRARSSRDDNIMRLALALPTDVLMAGAGGRGVDASGDGRTIVYGGVMPSGQFFVFVRRLDDLQVHALAGTALALDPSVSPDGRWVAYVSGTQLYKVPVNGGPPTEIGRASLQGTSWVDDGVIAAARDHGIWLFPANGQPPYQLTTPDTSRGERYHSYPIPSRDGQYVFYQANHVGGSSTVRLGVASVKTHRSALLNVSGIAPIGMIDDALIYARPDGAVMGVRMDLKNLRTVGEPLLLGEQVSIVAGGVPRAALSRSGTLVYQSGATLGQLSLVDAKGTMITLLAEPKSYITPRFSPDGRRVALSFDGDVWIYDVASATPTRLTTVPRNDRPEWTPDSRRVVFRSTRDGIDHLWWQPADGSGPAERLLDLANGEQEGVFSPDGKWIVLRTVGNTTKRDIYYRAVNGDTTLHPIAVSEFEELMPRLSPDGRWLTYVSDESGLNEVYVRAFPGPSGKVQVSLGGGSEPVWGPDGKTIYYRHGRDFIETMVTTGTNFSVVRRTKLFESTHVTGAIHANYDVSPDGKHFLVINRAGTDAQVIVIYNWAKEVRERLRGRG